MLPPAHDAPEVGEGDARRLEDDPVGLHLEALRARRHGGRDRGPDVHISIQARALRHSSLGAVAGLARGLGRVQVDQVGLDEEALPRR